MQQQEWGRKDTFNVLMVFAWSYQRALLVPFRSGYGSEALGVPGVGALVLMLVWAGFSGDPLMWIWIGFWMLCLVCRRLETARLTAKGERIHSKWDGHPVLMQWNRFKQQYVWCDRTARLLMEPLMMVIFWLCVATLSNEMGTPWGLARFLMGGAFVLPFVEIIRLVLNRNRTQALVDAQIEQQVLMEEFQQRWQ